MGDTRRTDIMDVVEAWEKQRQHETLETFFAKIEDELTASLPPKRNTRIVPRSKVCALNCRRTFCPYLSQKNAVPDHL